MSHLATASESAIPGAQTGTSFVSARIVVSDAETGSVLHEYVSAGARIMDGPGEPAVERHLAVPRGSVVLLEMGDRREAVARVIADELSVMAADVNARLLTLPAVAAWDLTPAQARSVVQAISRVGALAIAV